MESNTLKTVYIVGAGASRELDLPTGEELKTNISNLLDISFDGSKLKKGDHLIEKALGLISARNDINYDKLHSASKLISRALPQAISIDNFIDTHSDKKEVEICGKLAIVRSIIQAEQNSKLYNIKNNSFNIISKTWHNSFFKQLTENCTHDKLQPKLQNVTLIIFNYDRCIEHFLHSSFMNYYDITSREAADLVDSINIYHVYGQVGHLPWQNRATSIDYGADLDINDLLKIYTTIKTFTEGADPGKSEIIALQNEIINASRLVFLGFAFHPLNMNILSSKENNKSKTARIYATRSGISDSDLEFIQASINKSFPNKLLANTIFTDKYCADFFTQFWRSLSYSS